MVPAGPCAGNDPAGSDICEYSAEHHCSVFGKCTAAAAVGKHCSNAPAAFLFLERDGERAVPGRLAAGLCQCGPFVYLVWRDGAAGPQPGNRKVSGPFDVPFLRADSFSPVQAGQEPSAGRGPAAGIARKNSGLAFIRAGRGDSAVRVRRRLSAGRKLPYGLEGGQGRGT